MGRISSISGLCVTLCVSAHGQAKPTHSDRAVILDAPPAGAPADACTVPTVRDASKLMILSGSEPVTYVFACGKNRPAGTCAAMTFTPGSREMPVTVRFSTAGEQRNGWICINPGDSTSGWLPSNRLAPLPSTPAIPTADWLGWWRSGRDASGVKNDRLLITRSKTPNMLHVSGRAYWYGMNDNVHSGEVDADASVYGDTLHVVEDDGFCTVDLVYHLATHTFTASDNSGCGGMNVRFLGEWQRFTPKTQKAQ